MYDIVSAIIDHVPTTTYSSNYEQLITTVCGCIILMVFVVLIDLLYRVFRNFIN